jgi:hypothetical protein
MILKQISKGDNHYRLILFSDWLMLKKIFSSETAWPNGAKLGIDGPWVCPFQNCRGEDFFKQ